VPVRLVQDDGVEVQRLAGRAQSPGDTGIWISLGIEDGSGAHRGVEAVIREHGRLGPVADDGGHGSLV